MPYFTLDTLYSKLVPLGLNASDPTANLKPESLLQVLQRECWSPTGEYKSFESIKKTLEDHLTNTGNGQGTPPSKTQYYMIGSTGIVKNFKNETYWGEITKTGDLIPSLNDTQQPLNLPVSVFVTRDSYASPATRGTGALQDGGIDFFLNYMPNTVVSQMTPYLNVEFEIDRVTPARPDGAAYGPADILTTPSTMRFLLGSVAPTNLNDQTLRAADVKKYENDVNFQTHRSGMEIFLAPQSLTNMDTLRDTSARASYVKPFLPFASIEGFDITVVNAGSGKFAHKKAGLKLKVHDKSRLPELSEFMRGPKGYSKMQVWTTYGWASPYNRGEEDEYFKFINEKMINKEAWAVVNTQFSFDQSGQVSVTLELVSKAARNVQSYTVTAGGQYEKFMSTFQKAVETISEMNEKYLQQSSFLSDATAVQVLNSAATSGQFGDLKGDKTGKLKRAKDAILLSLKAAGAGPEQLKEFQTAINDITPGGTFEYDNVGKQASQSARTVFTDLARTPDPFLADDARSEYFEPALAKVISNFKSSYDARAAEIDKNAKKSESAGVAKIDLPKEIDVVSFGKLFLSVLIPAVANDAEVSELQVYFYKMNDQCGPMSGHSIAEFPINMTSLVYAYAEALKSSGSPTLTIEAFLGLIIETQFVDQRGIGYGMTHLFKPFDPQNPRNAEAPEKDADLAFRGQRDWFRKYGALKVPVIEMYIEAGKETGTQKYIKRVHIYDKQSNPYKLLQNVVRDSQGNLVLGSIDETAVRNQMKTWLEDAQAKDKDIATKIKELLDKTPGSTVEDAVTALNANAAEESKIKLPPKFDPVTKPGGQTYVIEGNKRAFKGMLMKTVPTIQIGANGSLVQNVTAASATNGALGAMNFINARKAEKSGQATIGGDGLSEVSGIPLKAVPMQVTMTTLGVPTAQLYQTFFIDFDTGTTIDNLYTCTQMVHNISKGKFTTQWTFAYSNGYGKFEAPASANMVMSGQAADVIQEVIDQAADKKADREKLKPIKPKEATPAKSKSS